MADLLADFWTARLYDPNGKHLATWKLPRDLRERLPYKLRFEAKDKHHVIGRVDFLDGFEQPCISWGKTSFTMLKPGEIWEFTIFDIEGVYEGKSCVHVWETPYVLG